MRLEQDIRDVLGRMATLSEASAATLAPVTSHSAAASSVPKGVAHDRPLVPGERPPSKETSLHGWWIWRFAEAFRELAAGEIPEFKVFSLYLLAERDWGERVYHSPDRMALRSGKINGREVLIDACPICHAWKEITARADPKTPPVCEDGHPPAQMRAVADGTRAEEAAARRVVELYEGISAAEVAVHEYTTEPAVKKARRNLGRDPETGRERPPFLDWTEEERARQIDLYRRHERGAGREVGAKSIANHFGVDKNTVKRYMVVERQPAAA